MTHPDAPSPDLDPRGLEAAILAYQKNGRSTECVTAWDHSERLTAAICAYLASAGSIQAEPVAFIDPHALAGLSAGGISATVVAPEYYAFEANGDFVGQQLRPLYAHPPSGEAEPFCYVLEVPDRMGDMNNPPEQGYTDFSPVPKPGYEPLYKGAHPPAPPSGEVDVSAKSSKPNTSSEYVKAANPSGEVVERLRALKETLPMEAFRHEDR